MHVQIPVKRMLQLFPSSWRTRSIEFVPGCPKICLHIAPSIGCMSWRMCAHSHGCHHIWRASLAWPNNWKLSQCLPKLHQGDPPQGPLSPSSGSPTSSLDSVFPASLSLALILWLVDILQTLQVMARSWWLMQGEVWEKELWLWEKELWQSLLSKVVQFEIEWVFNQFSGREFSSVRAT